MWFLIGNSCINNVTQSIEKPLNNQNEYGRRLLDAVRNKIEEDKNHQNVRSQNAF